LKPSFGRKKPPQLQCLVENQRCAAPCFHLISHQILQVIRKDNDNQTQSYKMPQRRAVSAAGKRPSVA